MSNAKIALSDCRYSAKIRLIHRISAYIRRIFEEE
jgi:hypothetical protein